MSNKLPEGINCIRCSVKHATKEFPINIPRKTHFGQGGLFNTEIMKKAVVPLCEECHTSFLGDLKLQHKYIKVKKGGLIIKPEGNEKWISLRRWVFGGKSVNE